MKNKKKLKITIISLSIFFAVILGVGAAGFYTVREYMFTKLLESYVEDEMMNSLGIDLEDIEGVDGAEAVVTDPIETSVTNPQKDTSDPQKEEDTSAKQETSPDEARHNPTPITKEEIKKVVKEKAKAINEAIPSKDKAEISALVLDNLSQEDISSLAGLAADGISQSDIEKAKELARSRFSEDQMAEVYGYYKQYKDAVLN